jgi:tetratricopeptide (TPR) repeat protein
MALQPKFKRGGDGSLPERRGFVDRTDLLAAFGAALELRDSSTPKVLVFWGLAGIGKSRLKRELRDRAGANPTEPLWAEVDFGLPTLREPQTALFSLRRQFAERHGVHFPTFDLVYAYLWRLTRPNTAPVQEGRALFEAGSLAAAGLSAAGVPFVSLVATVAEKASGPLKAWWTKRGREDLKALSRLDIPEIEERLPAYFAEDLTEYADGTGRRMIFFFDTYEALFQDLRGEEQRLLRDEWLRELVLQLPAALFVVCGREPLDWAELDPDWAGALEQHNVRELPDADIRRLLTSADVTDRRLQDRILLESRNVPFLVDLAIDTVREMNRGGGGEPAEEPAVLIDATAEVRLSERFLRYLSPAEQDTVEVLSVPRSFDRELFRDLCRAFETQFPLGGFAEICRFSFISERSPAVFQMHDVMGGWLRARLRRRDPERLRDVHLFLFKRFDDRLEGMSSRSVSPAHESAFAEAYYHSRQARTVRETVDWFIGRAEVFHEAGRDRPLLQAARALAADAEEELGRLDQDAIRMQAFLGEFNLPDPDEAERLLRAAVERARDAGEVGAGLLPVVQTHLARVLFFRHSRHDEALALLQEAMALFESRPVLDEPSYCLAVASLSACLSDLADYRAARDLCRAALSRVKDPVSNRYYFWVLNNLGYEDFRLGYFDDAEAETQRCFDVVSDRYGADSYNLWSPLSTLGEIRLEQGRYAEAEDYFLRSLELLELGEYVRGTTEVVATLAEAYAGSGKLEQARERALAGIEMAEAPRDKAELLAILADVALKEGRLEEAQAYLEECVTVAAPVVAEGNPWYSRVEVVRGRLERTRGRYREAEAHFREAERIVRTKIRPDHPRAGAVLLELAEVVAMQGRTAEAAQLRSSAVPVREKEGCVV